MSSIEMDFAADWKLLTKSIISGAFVRLTILNNAVTFVIPASTDLEKFDLKP